MAGNGKRWRVLAAILPLAAVGCSSGSKPKPLEPEYAALVQPATQEPKNDAERAILGQLGQLAAGAEAVIDGQAVVAGAPYAAASGRRCRTVTIRPKASGAQPMVRLACVVEGAWSFVPPVMAGPNGEGGER